MLDILQDIRTWLDSGKDFALATVTETWRSAPRGVGACMIVDETGKMAGSVSGGCVEGQVVKSAKEVLQAGKARKLKFGVSNDEAWSVGLSCGGAISVLVQPFFNRTREGEMIWHHFERCLSEDHGCVLIYGHETIGFYSDETHIGTMEDTIYEKAAVFLQHKKSQKGQLGDQEYFFHVFPPKNHLVIIGAAHITRDLITLAKQQDFRITVIDPRGLFYESLQDLVAEKALLRMWPADALPDIKLDDSVFAVLLTHDPKIDDQALQILLNSGVAYIGALGSKKTHQKRISRLLDAGFTQEKIDSIKGPIGLDIGAGSPAEIALSIMTEIIKVKNKA
jgi:xanthine dehydrogenase accessory factor